MINHHNIQSYNIVRTIKGKGRIFYAPTILYYIIWTREMLKSHPEKTKITTLRVL